jgi:hypothetical protein
LSFASAAPLDTPINTNAHRRTQAAAMSANSELKKQGWEEAGMPRESMR